MSTTTTTNTGLAKPDVGTEDNSWGTILNALFDAVDALFAKRTAVSVASGDVTLTASQYRCAVIEATGEPSAARNIVLPAIARVWTVFNNVGDASVVTFKTAAGTGVSVAPGYKVTVYSDGTNVTDGRGSVPLLVPASAILPHPVSGCGFLTNNSATFDVPAQWYLLFDPNTAEAAQFSIPTPSWWDAGAIGATVLWAPNGTSGGNVVWVVRAVAAGEGEAPSSFGSSATVTDAAGTTTGAMQRSDKLSVTPGGTPAAGDLLHVQVYRAAASGSDTNTDDARLFGVEITFN